MKWRSSLWSAASMPFKPWRMLSHGPDQANIEAFAVEQCRHALDEMTKDLGMRPNRQSAADIAIRACTILIGQNSSDYVREQSYYTREPSFRESMSSSSTSSTKVNLAGLSTAE